MYLFARRKKDRRERKTRKTYSRPEVPIARPSREPNTKRRISSYWGILFGEVGRQSRDTPRKADTARDTKQNCWDAGQHKHNLLTGRRSVDHWSLRQSIVATFTWAKEEEEEEGNCVPCPRESPPSTSRLATTKDNSLSLSLCFCSIVAVTFTDKTVRIHTEFWAKESEGSALPFPQLYTI